MSGMCAAADPPYSCAPSPSPSPAIPPRSGTTPVQRRTQALRNRAALGTGYIYMHDIGTSPAAFTFYPKEPPAIGTLRAPL